MNHIPLEVVELICPDCAKKAKDSEIKAVHPKYFVGSIAEAFSQVIRIAANKGDTALVSRLSNVSEYFLDEVLGEDPSLEFLLTIHNPDYHVSISGVGVCEISKGNVTATRMIDAIGSPFRLVEYICGRARKASSDHSKEFARLFRLLDAWQSEGVNPRK
jgi:hypothetical protein